MLQCVAVCCSVLQCVAVCCRTFYLHIINGVASGLLRISTDDIVYAHTTVCCSVLQCVAVCRIVLQFVAVCCSVLQSVLLVHSKCKSARTSKNYYRVAKNHRMPQVAGHFSQKSH